MKALGSALVLAVFFFMTICIANAAILIAWSLRESIINDHARAACVSLVFLYVTILFSRPEFDWTDKQRAVTEWLYAAGGFSFALALFYFVGLILYLALSSLQVMLGLVCLFVFKVVADHYGDF